MQKKKTKPHQKNKNVKTASLRQGWFQASPQSHWVSSSYPLSLLSSHGHSAVSHLFTQHPKLPDARLHLPRSLPLSSTQGVGGAQAILAQ